MLDRRSLLKSLIGLSCLQVFARPQKAFAEPVVLFTPELAQTYASDFLASFPQADGLIPDKVLPVFDIDGLMSAWIVYFRSTGSDCGFVLLDPKVEGLVSRCSLFSAENAIESPVASLLAMKDAGSYEELPIIMLSPLDLVVYSPTSRKALNECGDELDFPSLLAEKGLPYITWKDLFIDSSLVWGDPNFSVLGSSGMELSYITQAEAERNAGRYACVVSAMYSIAASLPHAGRMLIDIDDWGEYKAIWDATGTKPISTSGGVTYGSTPRSTAGDGFVRYCAGKGRSITSTFTPSPLYSTFKTQVNQFRHSIFHATVKLPDGSESGHAMAVQGWAQVKRGGLPLSLLSVFDGWTGITYLNTSYSGYLSTGGTFFGA